MMYRTTLPRRYYQNVNVAETTVVTAIKGIATTVTAVQRAKTALIINLAITAITTDIKGIS